MHSSLFRNTQDCLTDSNSPFLDVGFLFLSSKTPWNGCCSARGRKPGLGMSSGIYLWTKYRYFWLRGWRLLTASWTERNVSLDATARLGTSSHLRWVSHFGLGRNRQWYVVYVFVLFPWTLRLLHRSATCTGMFAATLAYGKVMDHHVPPCSFNFNLQGHRTVHYLFCDCLDCNSCNC